MPLSMQVKVLRVLQEQKVRRIGANDEISVDSRVITATNRDLGPMVENGAFRQDLYYRVSVIPLHVPSLRERRDDIPHLAEHFMRKFSARSGKNVTLSDGAVAALAGRQWKGNVRELEHTIERAVALTGDGQPINAEHCCANGAAPAYRRTEIPADGLHLPAFLNGLEKEYVEEALQRAAGNQTRAAALLQIPVHSLRHLLEKHDLR